MFLNIFAKGGNEYEKHEKVFAVVCLFAHYLVCFYVFSTRSGWQGPKVLDPSYKVVRLVKDTPFPGCNGATIGMDGALYVVHTATGTTTRIDLKTMKATQLCASLCGNLYYRRYYLR